MTGWWQWALDAVGRYPSWAGAIIFLIGLVETLPVLGYFVPGTFLMLAIGVLVGNGTLSPELAGGTLIAGGLAGDAAGYWLGYRYAARLGALRFFRGRRSLLQRARHLMVRHATKAILLSRMIGPIRPMIPVVAGLIRYPPWKFAVLNAASGLISATAHLLPGVLIGIGLELTGVEAGRAVAVIVLLAAVVWLAQLAARRLWRGAFRLVPQLRAGLRMWAAREAASPSWPRRYLAFAVLQVVDARYAAFLPLALYGAAALAAIVGTAVIAEALSRGDPIVAANVAVFEFFTGLRAPWIDRPIAVLAGLAEAPSVAALVVVTGAIMVAAGALRAAAYWILACGLGLASAVVLRLVVARAAPAAAIVAPQLALPNAETVTSFMVLGYIAYLVARLAARPAIRAASMATAFALVSVISLARLYLGAAYASGVASGLLLGIAWLAVLALVSEPDLERLAGRRTATLLAAGALMVLGVGTGLYATAWNEREVARYKPAPRITVVERIAWRQDGWRSMPQYRVDMFGEPEEPLNVQIAGTAETIARRLEAAGWRPPPRWTVRSSLAVLTAAALPPGVSRPVIPHVWNGRSEASVLVKAKGSVRLVLRLWDQGFRLRGGAGRLYLGVVGEEVAGARYLHGLLALPARSRAFDDAARVLAADLGARALRSRGTGWRPAVVDGRPIPWDGSTVVSDLAAPRAPRREPAGASP